MSALTDGDRFLKLFFRAGCPGSGHSLVLPWRNTGTTGPSSTGEKRVRNKNPGDAEDQSERLAPRKSVSLIPS